MIGQKRMAKKVKIGVFDIETSPNIGAYFQLYQEGNILWVEEHWHIMSFAVKDLHSSKSVCWALPDFKLYKKDPTDDSEVVKKLWEVFNEYDVLIAHNGQAFDTKKAMARFIYHRMSPPDMPQFVDTKLVAKRYFKFHSNKLEDLADYLKIGHKLATEKGLWRRCRAGDLDAWRYMKKYNIQDVVLLEKVYLAMLPYIRNHPNFALMLGEKIACPNCGSSDVEKRGYTFSRSGRSQRWRCRGCSAWHSSPLKEGSQIR